MAQAINRYFQRQAAQPEFYQEPLQMLAVALDAKQKRYDQGLALSEELYQTSLNALPQDRARADQIINSYQSSIDDIVEKSGGDYSTIQPHLYKLKRQIFKDFSPGGEAQAIETMFKRYNTALEAERKRIGKETTANQLGSMMNWFDQTYQGIGTKDPVTGSYTGMMELPSIAKYVDVNQLATDYGKEIVASKLKNVKPTDAKLGEWFQQNGKIWTKTSLGIEEITPERVRKVIEQGLLSNDEFKNYVRQLSKFGSPVAEEDIQNAIGRAVDTFSYRNVEYDQDMRFDPDHISAFRQRLRDQSLQRFLNPQIPVNTMPGPAINSSLSNNKVSSLYGTAGETKVKGAPSAAYPGSTSSVIYKTPRNNASFGENYLNMYNILSKQSPALKPALENLRKSLDNNQSFKGLSEQEKWQKFGEMWDNQIDRLQTVTTTTIQLPPTYIDNLSTIWPQQARAGQWYEIGKDGSTKLVEKKDLGEEMMNKPPLPVAIQGMGDNIGMWVPAPNGKQYIVTGTDDELSAVLKPIMDLHSPTITGKYGYADLGSPEQSFHVRSSIDLDAFGNAYIKLDRKDDKGKWVHVKDDNNQPVRGEGLITQLQNQAAGEIFRNSDIHQNVLRYGENARLFDAFINPVEID